MAARLDDDIFAVAKVNQRRAVHVAVKCIHDTNPRPPKPQLKHSQSLSASAITLNICNVIRPTGNGSEEVALRLRVLTPSAAPWDLERRTA